VTISRQLAHKIQDRLQLILSMIETDRAQQAVSAIIELAKFTAHHIEDTEEELTHQNRWIK
jgi:hypothetical protein